MKKRVLSILLAILVITSIFALSSCELFPVDPPTGENEEAYRAVYDLYVEYAENDGEEPQSYEDWLNSIRGEDGRDGKDGKDGLTPNIGYNGNWWIGDVDTGVSALPKNGNNGADGKDGVGIVSIEKVSSEGLVDTYKIIYTTGTTFTFTITNGQPGESGSNGQNGADGVTPLLRISDNYWEVSYDNGESWVSLGVQAAGEKGDKGDPGEKGETGEQGPQGEPGKDGVGIVSIEKVSSVGLVDTYEIRYTDGTTTTFTVTNGKNGDGTGVCEHSFGDWEVVIPTSCNCYGISTRSCLICGSGEYRVEELLDHEYAVLFVIDATQDGHKVLNCCSTCGVTKFDIGEHKYDENYVCIYCENNCYDYFEFELLEDGTYAVGAKNKAEMPTNIVIPATYNGLTVTSISESGFYEVKSETVLLPDSIINIGEFAFYGCENLKEISIPENVKYIRMGAFAYCNSLENVIIPDSVEFIDRAFAYCINLKQATVGKNVSSVFIPFGGCVNLEKVEISSENTAYHIENNCIIETNTNTLIQGYKNSSIPDYVTSIGMWSFCYRSDLTSIVIPSSVTLICSDAFDECYNLKTVYYQGKLSDWDNIEIESGNYYLTNADIHYYSEIESEDRHGHWHFVDGIPTLWCSGDIAIDEAVEPTCTTTGLTEGSHCADCGKVIVAQEVLGIIEHKFSNGYCLMCGIDGDYNEGTVLRMATGYNSAKTGLFFSADVMNYDTGSITLANGKTYYAGDLKPTWVAVSERLGINFEDRYPGQSAQKTFDYYEGRLDEVDMISGTVSQFAKSGAEGELINLAEYLDYMPNFKAFLDANPIVRLSITSDFDHGAIYCSPYFDGVNDVERVPLMRTDWVEKLLNGEGAFTAAASKNLSAAVYEPYMPTSGKVMVDAVSKDGRSVIVLVKDYDAAGNIIEIMNEALASGSVSGVEAVNMLRDYIDEAYNGYYGTNRADLFIGQDAAWDADELVALLRCVVANPQTLNGTDEVQGLFARETDNNQRRVDMFRFAGTLFGVRGLESRYTYLYVGSDGLLHDARQEAATYVAIERMNAMALEGLIASEYITNARGRTDTYLADDSGFMHYDYNQTQTVYNETKLQAGEKYMAVMIPVARWNDGTGEIFMRFTESWRSVKTDGWAISKAGVGDDVDKLYAALALIDYAYSEEGQILMSYGPDEFIKKNADGSYVTFNFNGKEMPVIADETYEELWEKASGNYTNYARMYLGSTISFVKSTAFEYQCTHYVGQEGMSKISNAIALGIIKHPELNLTSNPWYTSVPTVLPTTEAENNKIAEFTELSASGKFSTSKSTTYVKNSNLLVDIICFGYMGDGTSTKYELLNTVKTTWNGLTYTQIMNAAWKRLANYDFCGGEIEIDEAVEPTCTSTGLTEGSHCADCGKVIVAQKVVDMIPHNMVDGLCTMCGSDAIEYDITIWVSEVSGVAEQIQEQIDAFEAANPGIVINATIEGVSEYDAGPYVYFDVASAPDMYCFAQDYLARLVQASALAPLSDSASATVKANNDAGSVTAGTVAGQLYAYPMTSDNGYYIYYDKSIITNPDSLEQIIADCEAAKTAGNDNYLIRYALENAWYTASFFFATGCVSEWTMDENGKFIDINDTFNSPEGLIAMKGMQKLTQSSVYDSNADIFTNAAVVVTGTWNHNAAQEHFGENLGVTDLPSFTVDGQSYHLGSFTGNRLMGVKPQTDPEKAAVLNKLALWLTNEENQLARYNAFNDVYGNYYVFGPSNKNAQQSPEVQANASVAALALQNSYGTPQGYIHGSWWDIARVLGADARNATSDADLQASLDTYTAAINALLQKNPEELRAWTVIGNIQDSEWRTDFGMIEVAPNVWESCTLTLRVGDEFKIRQGGSWLVHAGTTSDSTGETESGYYARLQDGVDPNNIVSEVSGSYKIRFTWEEGTNNCTIELIPQ